MERERERNRTSGGVRVSTQPQSRIFLSPATIRSPRPTESLEKARKCKANNQGILLINRHDPKISVKHHRLWPITLEFDHTKDAHLQDYSSSNTQGNIKKHEKLTPWTKSEGNDPKNEGKKREGIVSIWISKWHQTKCMKNEGNKLMNTYILFR